MFGDFARCLTPRLLATMVGPGGEKGLSEGGPCTPDEPLNHLRISGNRP